MVAQQWNGTRPEELRRSLERNDAYEQALIDEND